MSPSPWLRSRGAGRDGDDHARPGRASDGGEWCDRTAARSGRDDRRRDRNSGGQDRTLTVNRLPRRGDAAAAARNGAEVLETGVLASTAELLEQDTGLMSQATRSTVPFSLRPPQRGQSDPRSTGGRTLFVLDVPFDPWRKRQTPVYREHGRLRVVVKGAPETFLDRSRLRAEERARSRTRHRMGRARVARARRRRTLARRPALGRGRARPGRRPARPRRSARPAAHDRRRLRPACS